MGELIPLFAVAITATGLLVALVVAVRNRTLFGPHLSIQFRLPVEFHKKRSRWMKRDPVALFVLNQLRPHDTVHLPIHIENKSRRKLTDVSLELVYPRIFYVNNREHYRIFDELLNHFPEKEEEVDSLRSQLAKRTASVAGDLVWVTHEIGTLRPGQSAVFYEVLDFPSRELCFDDPRFEKRMFGAILKKVAKLTVVRGVCHVRATLLSDLNKPKQAWLNVVSASGALTEALTDDLVKPYGAAHWMGEYPKGSYLGFRLPFPRAYRQPFSSRKTVDIMYPKLSYDVRQLSDTAIAASWFDGLGSSFAYGYVTLPGYDYFDLPRGTTVDQALMSIGYGRIPSLLRKTSA